MSGNSECGCGSDNCPHKTSEVTLFDGNFNSITVPAGSSLNDVLLLLESYVTTSVSNLDINYTLDAYSACLGLDAGTYSFQQIIQAIINKLCATASDLTSLQEQVDNIDTNPSVNTNQVTLEDIVLPSCFAAFSGLTSTDLFNAILTEICNMDEITPVPQDEAYDNSDVLKAVSLGVARDFIYGLIDNKSYVYEEITPTTSPTSFSSAIEPIKAVVDGYLIHVVTQFPITFNANEDTYVNLAVDGSYVTYNGVVGFIPPAFPSTEHNLYMFTTDGAGVVSLSQNYTSNPLNPAPLGIDAVDTVNIVDGAVTSDKMDTIGSDTTAGHVAILQVSYNTKGRMIGSVSNMDLTGISDTDRIKYNTALNRFEPADATFIPAAGVIPKANGAGDNLDSSALSESINQIKSTKRIEIKPVGATEDVSDAILNVAAGAGAPGGILFPRLTHTEAGGLSLLNDGLVIYVTSTDATFTSVGFWGIEAGVWVKL
jgi:hypothetical protein